MHLTPMPSALLTQILRAQDLCQKQVVAGDRGRSVARHYRNFIMNGILPLPHPQRSFLGYAYR